MRILVSNMPMVLLLVVVSFGGLVEGCGEAGVQAPTAHAGATDYNPENGMVQDEGGADPTEKAAKKTCGFQVGWTSDVVGGLGGRIIKVTTLAVEGPGSISAAIHEKGPRVIVFEVGGTINLKKHNLVIDQPYLTIAGQTAPEPGITFIDGGIEVSTHDVVIQHIRVRPGQGKHGKGWEPDGISLEAASNVIIDHCSITWAIDENLSASGPRFEGKSAREWRRNTSHHVTFSNNIIAEGLNNSTHSLGSHSKGSLIHDNVTSVLIYGNLYANNADRNPLFKGGSQAVLANNYIFNPKRNGPSYALVENEWGTLPAQIGLLSLVGNVYREGPDTRSGERGFFHSVYGPVVTYIEDNLLIGKGGSDVAEVSHEKFDVMTRLPVAPLWPPGFKAIKSEEVLKRIQSNVGARPWSRDRIDTRIVNDSIAGIGRHIDHENDVGGFIQTTESFKSFNRDEWDDCFEKLD